jgi:tripartite-type tricarboxylate transporter receptor subunit TctC
MPTDNTHLISRRFFNKTIAASGVLAVACPFRSSNAQDASKPVRIVVPFAPGGSNDIVGRAMAQQLSVRLKRNVYVENRPGGGGTLGSDLVARSDPDGSTLLLISSTFTMNPAIMKLSYDPVKSFTPVAMLGSGPSVIAVASNLPFSSIKELIDYTRKNPGKVNFGSAGVASFQHFAIELFKLRSGADLTVVHYKGGVPALTDLAAGHIQVSLGSLIQMQPFLKSGRIKLLAVAGPRRAELFPNVPTLKESGIDVDASNWWALLAPAGTPQDMVTRLHHEANAVLEDADVKKRFASEGAETMPMSVAEFEKFLSYETGKWAKVAKETAIRPE